MDPGVVDLSRLQFAATALYHFLFVPLTLGLIALLEAGGTRHWIVLTLLWLLLIARLLHPVGMFAPVNSPRQFACRGGGILVTLLVMTVAAVLLLVRAM